MLFSGVAKTGIMSPLKLICLLDLSRLQLFKAGLSYHFLVGFDLNPVLGHKPVLLLMLHLPPCVYFGLSVLLVCSFFHSFIVDFLQLVLMYFLYDDLFDLSVLSLLDLLLFLDFSPDHR
jgi:hypothetical protein